MKETLVILAAGMGSRYGGLKQIDTLGSNGESIIDFTIYDAIQTGFKKLVLIIRKEHKEIFEEHLVKKIRPFIEVEYAYQDINDIPENIQIPQDRAKPWGTTHALLACRNILKDDPFVVCNADDFYGYDAYKKAYEGLSNLNEGESAVVSYPFNVTASDFGSVKRGVLETDSEGYVTELIESKMELVDGMAKCEPLSGEDSFIKEANQPVSMNLFCFTKEFLNPLEEDFNEFMHNGDLLKGEALIPDAVRKHINNHELKVKNVVTKAIWSGVTYKEDLPILKETLNKLVSEGEYPSNLWN